MDTNFIATDTGMRKDLKDLTRAEMVDLMESLGEKSYRGDQIFSWIHEKMILSYEDMTNVPKSLREKLSENYDLMPLRLFNEKKSHIDGTRKYLFGLKDGDCVESVLMEYNHGESICISSQAGCRMGCTFCASGKLGLSRSLQPSEMLDQIYSVLRINNKRNANVVIMGTGEPLDNYDNLIRFIRIITDENGLNISQRHITVSTCGLAPGIKRLADEKLQITLAISLHSAIDAKRSEIMPVNRSYPLSELTEAAMYYFEQTGRRITLEYSLIHGVNDDVDDSDALIDIAKRLKAHVNLIPVNPVSEMPFYRPPEKEYIYRFQNRLEKSRINVTIRREMGRDINGACGQLRLHKLSPQSTVEVFS